MKIKIVILMIVFATMSINTAIAGWRHGHNNHHHSEYHYDNYNYDHYNSHSYGHYNYSHHQGYGHSAAYLLGGLIVGGVIGATLLHSYNNSVNYSEHRSLNRINSYSTNNHAIKRSYVIQADGACYLISHVNNGNLVLLPASYRNCE